jgi:hypothetical protein
MVIELSGVQFELSGVQFCAFKTGNTIGEFTFVFPESCLS